MLAHTTQHRHQQPQWQIHGNKQRLFAASFAVLITLCLALQFNRQSVNHFVNDTQTKFITLLTFETTPVIPRKTLTPEPAEKIVSNKSLIKPTRDQVRSLPVETSVVATPATNSPNHTPPALQQAPTPLLLDSKAINRAYNDSKSDIQKMAEASGKELNTPLKTKYDRFQTAAEEAAIPDCISANSGGSLLSIPVLAYKALAGKCK